MNNNRIIPVTYEIRNYLNNQLLKEEEINYLKKIGLSAEKYNVIVEKGKTTIVDKKENSKQKQETIDAKIAFLKDIASKMDKSIIWIYQELVLKGYGEYIDENSDMYQASLLAYNDVMLALNNHPEEVVRWYEDFCILNGSLYEEAVIYKKKKHKKDKKGVK